MVIYLFNNLQEPCLLKDEKSAWEEGQKRARTPLPPMAGLERWDPSRSRSLLHEDPADPGRSLSDLPPDLISVRLHEPS